MNRIVEWLGIQGLVLGILLVVMTALCLYFFVKIDRNREVVDRQGFRQLERLCADMKRKDSLTTRMTGYFGGQWYVRNGPQTTLLKGFGEIAKNLRSITKEAKKKTIKTDPETINYYFAPTNRQKKFYGIRQDTLWWGYPLAAFVKPMIKRDFFSDFVIIRNNAIAFSTLPGDLKMFRSELLDGSKPVRETDAKQSLVTGTQVSSESNLNIFAGVVRKVQLRGTDYQLFIEPVSFHDGSAWFIGGLIKDKTYGSAVRDLPSHILVIFISILWIILFSLPILRVFIISPKERLTGTGVTLIGISIVTGTLLFVSVLSQQFIWLQVRAGQYLQITRLNDAVRNNFKKESQEILQLITMVDRITAQGAALPQLTTSVWDSGATRFRPFRGPWYPYYKSIFWADSKGDQIAYVTPYLKGANSNVGSREYFRNPERYRSDSGWYNMEPIHSQTTGEWSVAFSMPSMLKGAKTITLTTSMYSLKSPLLQQGYSYCIMDSKGKIWVHSGEELDMFDNFLNECGRDNRLINTLASGNPGEQSIVMRNRTYLAHIAPIGQTDLFVVTMADPTLARSIAALTALFVLLFYAAIFLFLGAVYLLLKFFIPGYKLLAEKNYAFGFILPGHHHAASYNRMMIVNLVLFAILSYLQLGGVFQKTPFSLVLIIIAVIVVVHCMAMFVRLSSDRIQDSGKQRRVKKEGHLGYVFFALSWLAAAVILPVIVIEIKLFEEEAANYVRREQQFLGRQINERNEYFYRFYQDNLPPQTAYKLYETRVGCGGYYYYTNATSFLSFTESPPGLKGHHTDDLLNRIRFRFDQVMDETDKDSPEHLVGSEYGVETDVVSTYFDLVEFNDAGKKTIKRAKLITANPWEHLFAPVREGKPDKIAIIFWLMIVALVTVTGVLLNYLARVLFFRLHPVGENLSLSKELARISASGVSGILISSRPPSPDSLTANGWTLFDLSGQQAQIPVVNAGGILVSGFASGIHDANTLEIRLNLLSELAAKAPFALWLEQEPEPSVACILAEMNNQDERDKSFPLILRFKALVQGMPGRYPAYEQSTRSVPGLCSRFSNILVSESMFNPGIENYEKLLAIEFEHEHCGRKTNWIMNLVMGLPCCLAEEQLILRIQELSTPFYERAWKSLTTDEQFLLVDLAQDGLVNLKNHSSITRLLRTGFLRQTEQIEFVSRAFRNFILTRIDWAAFEVQQKKNDSEGNWSKLSIPLKLVAISILVFLFITQQNFLSNMNSILVSAAAILAVFLKISGIFTSLKPGPKP